MSTYIITTADDLNVLLADHSALLSSGNFAQIVAAIPEEFTTDFRTRLLQEILRYHLEHKVEPTLRDWNERYTNFFALRDAAQLSTPLAQFYVENYCFLSGRNANLPGDRIVPHLTTAMRIATNIINTPERHRLLGFLMYNHARWVHSGLGAVASFPLYQGATPYRVAWYQYVKESGQPEDVIKGAATQVWKMREDFPTFYPDKDISELGISDELFEEVAALANRDFSVKQ